MLHSELSQMMQLKWELLTDIHACFSYADLNAQTNHKLGKVLELVIASENSCSCANLMQAYKCRFWQNSVVMCVHVTQHQWSWHLGHGHGWGWYWLNFGPISITIISKDHVCLFPFFHSKKMYMYV